MAKLIENQDTTEFRFLGMRTASIHDRQFSFRDVGIAVGIAIGLYLFNGENAATACTLLTAVPAAAFSYKVAQSQGHKTHYKSLLFFWTAFGVMSAMDPLLNHMNSYFLGKFILLAAVFASAASKNKEVFEKMISVDSIKTEITQCVTSIVSVYDSEGFPVQSPPMTAFSEDTTAMPLRSCNLHCVSSEEDDMMSTQRDTSPIKKFNENKEVHGVNRALTPHPTMVREVFGEYSESSVTICPAFGDLVTNPMAEVMFQAKDDMKTVTVVNISGENAMWALKSNALHKLSAMPACGVILSGGTQTIKLVRQKWSGAESGDNGNDKVAIDYALVGGEKKYSPNFINRNDKKRHLLHISYFQ